MAFELWSGASGNLLSVHETEAEALAAVRRVAAVNDPAYVAALGLLYESKRGRSRLIAEGEALVQRALSAAAVEASSSPTSRTASA